MKQETRKLEAVALFSAIATVFLLLSLRVVDLGSNTEVVAGLAILLWGISFNTNTANILVNQGSYLSEVRQAFARPNPVEVFLKLAQTPPLQTGLLQALVPFLLRGI